MIFRRMSFWFALMGILFTLGTLWGGLKKAPPPPPLEPPPRNPFQAAVAASGIIEAVNENVRIAPPVQGLVTRVFVTVNDQVEVGEPLFQLDDRELQAKLLTRETAIPSAVARIAEQKLHIQDLATQLARLRAIHDRRAVSEDDLKRKWYELEKAKRALVRARADFQLIISQRDEMKALVDRFTIRAPRSGTILQVNIRAGEYARPGADTTLMLLGDTETLQVRANVDEVNAPMVQKGSPAVAYLKGSTKQAIPLDFDRIEPYIVPKLSLTGDNIERVDTRVLQIIYRFERPSFPVYVGQQVDVFIQRVSLQPKEETTSPEFEKESLP